MKQSTKNLILSLLLFLFIAFLLGFFSGEITERQEIPLSQLIKEINEGKVQTIEILGDEIFVTLKDGGKSFSRKESEAPLIDSLINLGVDKEKLSQVEIQVKKAESVWNWLMPILIYLVSPLIFLLLFFWLMSRQTRSGAGEIFDFTRAKAKVLGPGVEVGEKITFKDIADLEEAKEELQEVISFLKNPKRYLEMGAKIPRGVLLIGPPGTGKTMLAKAVANEVGVPFFSISGSEFVELFVGVGAARIRSLFSQARKTGKAIIFIDEIDSIGKIRGVGITGGHEEREQTLNQLLAEMDGISKEEGLVILAATNRPELLDPALLRPGRFDRRVVLDLPDVKGREEILKIHCRGKPLALGVNLREIAERTPGFSGADLANLVNEAALLAAKRGKRQIFQEEFLEAIEKVLLGPERKSHLLTEQEKKIASYHEAGHAIVSAFLKKGEPIRKISIVARGLAAGYTLKTPKEERKIRTKSEFLSEIATLLGGYLAEKIKFGEMTTGATNDLKVASILARKMVKEYGMSSLGPITFGEKEELLFLGKEFEVAKDYSEKLAERIDNEVQKIIKEAERKALNILKEKRKILEKVAKKLIEKETIEKEEFEELIGKKVMRNEIIPLGRGYSEDFKAYS